MRYSYKGALQKLSEYAIKEGYKKINLEYTDVSNISWVNKTLNQPKSIDIEKGYTFEVQTYIMLHELGHHVLRKDWEKFEKKLPIVAHAEKKGLRKEYKYKRRGAFHVSSLEEEFLAWDEGLKLGIRFGIKINMKTWIRLKSKFLKQYIIYYATLNK